MKFSFKAISKTREGAIKALTKGLDNHTTDYHCDPDWYYPDSIEVEKIALDMAYRDCEELFSQDWESSDLPSGADQYTFNQRSITMLVIVDAPKVSPRTELTQEQKEEWFDKVKPTKNWKMPISRTIILTDESQINDVMHSIEWFVGGMTDFTIIKRTPKYLSVRFDNAGYYNNIGA
jgi:hypothetical protein